jgi:hypothetical protein
MQIGDPKRGMSLGGQVYVTLTNFCLQRTLHNRCRADSPIDLHPLHRMDPTATASTEPSTVLPTGDSILDTLGAEVLAAMSCSSSPPARPHATVLRGHDGCPEARRHAPRRDRLGRPHRCRDLDGDDMNVCLRVPGHLKMAGSGGGSSLAVGGGEGGGVAHSICVAIQEFHISVIIMNRSSFLVHHLSHPLEVIFVIHSHFEF